jgi:hypothetical protein
MQRPWAKLFVKKRVCCRFSGKKQVYNPAETVYD